MAFTGNFMCTSFKQELLFGVHDFDSSTGDAFKLALYDNNASFTAATTAYTASDDPDVRAATQRGFGRLWEIVTDKSGLGPDEIRPFFAMGMLLNVAAAMDLPSSHASWAEQCVPPGKLRHT